MKKMNRISLCLFFTLIFSFAFSAVLLPIHSHNHHLNKNFKDHNHTTQSNQFSKKSEINFQNDHCSLCLAHQLKSSNTNKHCILSAPYIKKATLLLTESKNYSKIITSYPSARSPPV